MWVANAETHGCWWLRIRDGWEPWWLTECLALNRTFLSYTSKAQGTMQTEGMAMKLSSGHCTMKTIMFLQCDGCLHNTGAINVTLNHWVVKNQRDPTILCLYGSERGQSLSSGYPLRSPFRLLEWSKLKSVGLKKQQQDRSWTWEADL